MLAAMILALTLCCAGCVSRPLASLHQGPLGNAVLLTLPAGSRVQLPTAAATAQLRAAFLNEVAAEDCGQNPGAPDTRSKDVRLIAPLKLCTPAYLSERDLRELQLLQQLDALRLENQTLRLK